MLTWKQQYKERNIPQQTFLGQDLIIIQNKTNKKEVLSFIDLPLIVQCPFCLCERNKREFLKLTKKGISTMLNCPECKNQMKTTSIIVNQDVQEYAKWVFNYSLSGFWDKCPFKKFNERLYKMGLSRAFWDCYKMFKGEHRK